MQSSVVSALSIFSFLCVLAFSESKQAKDGRLKLQPRLQPLHRKTRSEDGLPGEVEFEVDLSDQARIVTSDRGSGGPGQDQGTGSFFSR